MTTLTPNARSLHAAAHELFGEFMLSLPPAEKARIENLRGSIAVDVRLDVKEACISFHHCTLDGARETLGEIALPPLPCDGSCIAYGALCVECDKSGAPGVTREELRSLPAAKA